MILLGQVGQLDTAETRFKLEEQCPPALLQGFELNQGERHPDVVRILTALKTYGTILGLSSALLQVGFNAGLDIALPRLITIPSDPLISLANSATVQATTFDAAAGAARSQVATLLLLPSHNMTTTWVALFEPLYQNG
jgi:hypothetical protein